MTTGGGVVTGGFTGGGVVTGGGVTGGGVVGGSGSPGICEEKFPSPSFWMSMLAVHPLEIINTNNKIFFVGFPKFTMKTASADPPNALLWLVS